MSVCSDFVNKDVRLSISSFDVNEKNTTPVVFYIVTVELRPRSLRYSVPKSCNDFKDLYDAAIVGPRGQILEKYNFPEKLCDTAPESLQVTFNQLLSCLLEYGEDRLTKELWNFTELKDHLEIDSASSQGADAVKPLTDMMKVSSGRRWLDEGCQGDGVRKRSTTSAIAQADEDADAYVPAPVHMASDLLRRCEYLLACLLNSKYYLRLAALVMVAINQYWSFNDWYDGKYGEDVYKQYFLTMSSLGLFSSYILTDYIHTCALNAELASETTKGDLTQEDNRDDICKISPWNAFCIVYISFSGATTLLLENLKTYDDSGKIEPVNSWATELPSSIFWFLAWIAVYYFLPAIINDVAAYRNKQFSEYVKRKAVPMLAIMICLELFCITVSTFVAKTALENPFLVINSYWSSGVGCMCACFLIPICISIYFYSIGAGHLKLEIFAGKKADNSTDEKTKMTGALAFGINVITQSLFAFLFFILICISLLYSTFDCSGYYFIVYIVIIYTIFVAFTIYYIRPQSPVHLANILACSGYKYHVFISHAQEPAQDAAAYISTQLKLRGVKVWRDMEQDEITNDIMRKAIEDSMCVIAFLTKDIKNKDEPGHVKTSDKIKGNGEWKYDIQDDERGSDGYWINGKYTTQDNKKQKSCSLFRKICAMELSHSIYKGKEVIHIRETRPNYGFLTHDDLTDNLPNQFYKEIAHKEVLEFQFRGMYEDAFYKNLVVRIERACKIAKKSGKKKPDDEYDYHIFLVFADEDKMLADHIIGFFTRKDKDVKFCKMEYYDKERDVMDKIYKSEKQVILLNDLSSPSPSVQMYLECLNAATVNESGGGRGGRRDAKSLNFIFVREESIVKRDDVDVEKGFKSSTKMFKNVFKDAKIFPAATTDERSGSKRQASSGLFGQDNPKLELFYKDLLKDIADFAPPVKKGLYQIVPIEMLTERHHSSLGR